MKNLFEKISKITLNTYLALKNCQTIPTSSIFNTTNKQIDLTMNCESYIISKVTDFGLTSSYNLTTQNDMYCQNFTTYLNITTDSTCSFDNYLNNITSTQCLGKSNCKITADLTQIARNCTSTPKYANFYFAYECYDKWVAGGVKNIQRVDFSWVVVSLDIGSMFSLLVCLLIIGIAQQRTNKFFKENVIEISDYTIHFKDMKFHHDTFYIELDTFMKHLYDIKKIEIPKDEENDFIYDVNFPVLTDSKLDKILERNKINEKINNLRQDLLKNEKSYSIEKLEKLTKKLSKLKDKEENLRMIIVDSQLTNLEIINDIFVTFTTQKIKNKLAESYKRGCCKRCCLIFCCQFHKIKHL